MNRERFWFLITNLAGVGMTVAPVFYPPAAILASPEVQGAVVASGTLLANVARDIVRRAK